MKLILFKIMALRKKVAESKEKAQSIIAMANRRITDLAKMWNEPSSQVEREAFRSNSNSLILR
ncbi:hypothetical protein OESDEN_18755 [Oesophagostomum dentatum]|uniref:Uncharacterized protein n=1 Tax=Oesophagostomum dentatum TaxID=61180 RepID=A0A0B1S8C8_OESDE|nr:hypothetical protein OESDEN_18755 [Oesophagostomum dentatum]